MGKLGAAFCAGKNSAHKTSSKTGPKKRAAVFSMCSPGQLCELVTYVSENANLYHSEPPFHPRVTCALAHQEDAAAAAYGLRRGALSPLETLAQSVSTIAPTTTPAATIPLVCALAGNGTWLAYLLATIAVLLVALCIARFARYSASPGSLYTYASM